MINDNFEPRSTRLQRAQQLLPVDADCMKAFCITWLQGEHADLSSAGFHSDLWLVWTQDRHHFVHTTRLSTLEKLDAELACLPHHIAVKCLVSQHSEGLSCRTSLLHLTPLLLLLRPRADDILPCCCSFEGSGLTAAPTTDLCLAAAAGAVDPDNCSCKVPTSEHERYPDAPCSVQLLCISFCWRDNAAACGGAVAFWGLPELPQQLQQLLWGWLLLVFMTIRQQQTPPDCKPTTICSNPAWIATEHPYQ